MSRFKLVMVIFCFVLPSWARSSLVKEKKTKKEKISLVKPKDDLPKNPTIPFEKYVLANGLEVILSEDHSSPFVATNIWFHTGAVNEVQNKTGLAHLFEHLMFEGSAFAKDDLHFTKIDAAGGFAINASTSFDRTNFFQTVPKNQIALVLALEASRMSFLTISKEKLDEQREVVRREREQVIENAPYGLATLSLWQRTFPKSHPFYGRVIGSHRDLEAASLNDVKSFYDRYYGPSNATLTIVGDFQKDEVKGLVAKYFGTLPRSAPVSTPKIPQIKLKEQEIFRFDEKIGRLGLVRIQYLTPALYKEGDADLDILSSILGGGDYGRLSKALVREQRIAGNVSVYQQSLEQISVFNIDILLNPGVDPNLAIAETDKIMSSMIKDLPSTIEIERAKNTILTNYYFAMQEFGGSSGKAEAFQSYNRFAKDPGFMSKDLARYQAVTQKTLKIALKKYLPTHARKILIATPVQAQMAHKE